MTAKNAILLIIKQSSGIDYNSILAKIAPNYGSVNSARAALSRAIKDMNAVGLVEKKDNRLFATEKGQIQIRSEMKNKLLIKLNQTVQGKNNVQEIDAIVEQLAVLIERSKADADLLKAAKGATTFSVSDLRSILEQVHKRMGQLNYLHDVFQKQIDSLQQMDFTDSVSFPLNPVSMEKIRLFLGKTDSTELLLDSKQTDWIENLALQLNEKTKSGTLLLPKTKIETVFELLGQQNQPALPETSLRISQFTVKIANQQCTVTGPFSQLETLKKQ